MSKNIEYEKTYLAAMFPEDLHAYKHFEIRDKYFPMEVDHPYLRLRSKNGRFEITKKSTMSSDASTHEENTISLSKEEFEALYQAPGLELHKIRFVYPYQQIQCEIDVYLDLLQGLVVVDIETDSQQALNELEMPSFCLRDVTDIEFIAAGKLSGKSYEDIKHQLEELGYKPLDSKELFRRLNLKS